MHPFFKSHYRYIPQYQHSKFMRPFLYPTEIPFSIPNNDTPKNVSTTNMTSFLPSPSLETRSFNKIQTPFETSFEKEANSEYSSQIWQASVSYLKKGYAGDFDEKTGLNDPNIFEDFSESEEQEKNLEEAISKNRLLNNREKRQLQFDLKFQTGLSNLLQQLCLVFREEIFDEIVYVCNETWDKYLPFKKAKKVTPSLQIMNFKTILNLNLEEQPEIPDSYCLISDEEIISEAKNMAEEMAGTIFLNSKIKFINLMEAEGKKTKEVREQFTNFIEAIVKGVLFSLQGYYMSPQEEKMEEEFESQEECEEIDDAMHWTSECRKIRKEN